MERDNIKHETLGSGRLSARVQTEEDAEQLRTKLVSLGIDIKPHTKNSLKGKELHKTEKVAAVSIQKNSWLKAQQEASTCYKGQNSGLDSTKVIKMLNFENKENVLNSKKQT